MIRKITRKFIFMMMSLFFILLFTEHTFAIEANIDIYDGAISREELLKKYPELKLRYSTSSFYIPEEFSNDYYHQASIIGKPYEGANEEVLIDYIYLDFQTDYQVYEPYDFRYESDDLMVNREAFSLNSHVRARYEIRYHSAANWEDLRETYLERGYTETTIEGFLAFEKIKNNYEYDELTVNQDDFHDILILLVDDTHIPGRVTLYIESELWATAGNHLPEGGEWLAMQRDNWNNEVVPYSKSIIAKMLADAKVELKRERIYDQELGVIPEELKEKSKEKEDDFVEEIVDSDADKEKGSVGVAISIAAVAAILGGLGAAGGISASGSENEEGNSHYKMYLKKDFGNSIKYDDKPVIIQTKIVEVRDDNSEIDRVDLLPMISISGSKAIEIVSVNISDNYVCAEVVANSDKVGVNPTQATISIKFSSAEGSFTNNVKFELIGDPFISLEKDTLSVLAGSKQQFRLPVQFVDFINKPSDIRFEGDDLDISLEADESDNLYIVVSDNSDKIEKIETFYKQYPHTIYANDNEEVVKANFTVLLCYEGILVDFLGQENEILAYKDSEDNMPITYLGIQAGVWNDEYKRLDMSLPNNLEVFYADPEGIYEIIGLSYDYVEEESTSERAIYAFSANKSLPSPDKIKGSLYYSALINDEKVENETEIYLIPDLLEYAKDLEVEFENCVKIINTYMPFEVGQRKREELYRDKHKLGLEDLKLYRQQCWQIASRMILQEKEDYLKESYKIDEYIAYLELTVFIGDVAFDLALMPFGGPITGFLVANAKDSFLELVEMYVNDEDVMSWQAFEEIMWNRLTDGLGSLDNFFDYPDKADYKAKSLWLSTFFIYRVFYRWYNDVDDAGNTLGLYEALKNGAHDVLSNRAMAYLGQFMENSAKKHKVGRLEGIELEEEALEKAKESIAEFIKSIQFV